MSDVDGTCEYVLNPDEPETWGGKEGDDCYVDEELLNEDGVWTCPHEAEKERDLCIFHIPTNQKDDNEVVDVFLQNVNNDNKRRRLQFFGANFGEFDISKQEIVAEDAEIWLSHSNFKKEVNLTQATVNTESLRIDGVNFNSRTIFRRAEFTGGVSFRGAEFGGEVEFKYIQFGQWADFINSKFVRDVSFRVTKFSGGANFIESEFNGMADFRRTEFNQETNFSGSEFSGRADFINTEFNQETNFSNSDFNQVADFIDSNFREEVYFAGVKFGSTADFESVNFGSGADFRVDEGLTGAEFSGADLTDTNFTGVALCNADYENALLSRATLFGTDLRGAKISGTVLGDVRIDEDTQFLGHPSDDNNTSPHTFSDIRSQQKCVYDPEYKDDNEHKHEDKAKSVYRALEELGRKHARPRLQARSFVRRQDLQKKDYWDDATADGATLEERLIAGARWSRARVARATLLYGESPWRVIAWSLGIIFSFALLYPLGGWMKPADSDPITYAQIASNPVEILNSLYYSTLTYTALGFGDFQPVGLGRLLTTVETGFGAVMLALLVFILGRRAAR